MNVAVLGADAAGRAIARRCVTAGHDVSLYDDDANAVMDAIDAVQAAIDDAVSAGDIDERERDAADDRIEATTGLAAAVAEADVVVEATDVDRDARRDLFAEVEELVGDETLIATSDDGTSLTAVAAGLRIPGRAIGLHFVDPAAASLVEVVVAEQTTESAADEAVSFAEGLGCESIVVRDAPGFAASRLSLALAVEAMHMIEEGVAGVAAVDRAMEAGHDHPVGPLAAADAAGLDARLEQLEYLAGSLGDRFAPPPVLREKVEAGDLGRKTGEGFYVWEGGERTEPSEPDPTPELREESPAGPDDV